MRTVLDTRFLQVPVVFNWFTQAARTEISCTITSDTRLIAVHANTVDSGLLNFFELVIASLLAGKVFVEDVARFTLSTFIHVTLAFCTSWVALVTGLVLRVVDLSFWFALRCASMSDGISLHETSTCRTLSR